MKNKPKAMIATKYEDFREHVSFPCAIQPKIDGVRCLAKLDEQGRMFLFYGRSGRLMQLPHISQLLERAMVPGSCLDGEIYVHGWTFDKISGLLRSKNKDKTPLQFHFFDCVDLEKSFLDRYKFLLNGDFESRSVLMVKTEIAHNKEEIEKAHNNYVTNGYEGAIVRNLHSKYVGDQSIDLQKVKLFEDQEFSCVGMHKGKNDNPVFEMITEQGKTFNACADNSEIRSDQSFIGQRLKVKFFGRYETGIPRHATVLGLRDAEDLPTNTALHFGKPSQEFISYLESAAEKERAIKDFERSQDSSAPMEQNEEPQEQMSIGGAILAMIEAFFVWLIECDGLWTLCKVAVEIFLLYLVWSIFL